MLTKISINVYRIAADFNPFIEPVSFDVLLLIEKKTWKVINQTTKGNIIGREIERELSFYAVIDTFGESLDETYHSI